MLQYSNVAIVHLQFIGKVIIHNSSDISGKWEAFKHEVAGVCEQRVLVRVKGKAGRCTELWMRRDTEALVTKKNAYVRDRRQ